jgi:hypothetical protein
MYGTMLLPGVVFTMTAPGGEPQPAPSTDPLTLVQAFLDACNTGQPEKVAAFLGPDTWRIWDYGALGAVVARGREALSDPLPRFAVINLAQVAGDTVAGDLTVSAPGPSALADPLGLHLLVTVTGDRLAYLYGLYDEQAVAVLREYWAAHPDAAPRLTRMHPAVPMPGQAALQAFIEACNQDDLPRVRQAVTPDAHLIWDTRALGARVGLGRAGIAPPNPHFQVLGINAVAPEIVLADLIVNVGDLPTLPDPARLRMFATSAHGELSNCWVVLSPGTVNELQAYQAAHPGPAPAPPPASPPASPLVPADQRARWWPVLLAIGLAALAAGLFLRRSRQG